MYNKNKGDDISMEIKKIPVGISDFKQIIESNYYYVDKSLFIKDIWDIASKAILIPRPRRFGKTLNISMLKYYFEKTEKDYSNLFYNLAIFKESKEYTSLQGQYPVIFITFKDVNANDFELCYEHLKSVIIDEYKRHRYLLEDDFLYPEDKKLFGEIINNTANRANYENALKNLSKHLSKYYNKNVIILIDEYDTPIQQGYLKGYYDEIIGFMRNFLSGGLKDNSTLEKGILTGILRASKESIFTGLNNFEVYSILKDEFSKSFGLLENEVYDMLKYYNLEFEIEDVKAWYNGYTFGESTIYNPWSILSLAKNYKYGLVPHWMNSSGNYLVRKLITEGGLRFKSDIEKLIKGESVEKVIDENVVFADLDRNPDAVWSFLLFTGYLKLVNRKRPEDEGWLCELKIPNKEVRIFYTKTIMEWFKGSTSSEKMQEMLQGLIDGNIVTFEYYFKLFVLNTMSYFDPTGEEPERVYQAFVMGLLVNLSDIYYVKSNRESGFGRYDIAMIPKNIKLHEKGIIFEFKRANPATNEAIEEALVRAEEQIEKKQYEVEIIEAGVKKENVVKIAVAFRGKEVCVKWK